jgi:hypothetical protein
MMCEFLNQEKRNKPDGAAWVLFGVVAALVIADFFVLLLMYPDK